MNLKVGGLIAAAVMGVVTEIGSQFVSQKWDEMQKPKVSRRHLASARAKTTRKKTKPNKADATGSTSDPIASFLRRHPYEISMEEEK